MCLGQSVPVIFQLSLVRNEGSYAVIEFHSGILDSNVTVVQMPIS